MQNRIYLKGINGLRTIAAIAVVISHISISLKFFKLPALQTTNLAGFGVTIFFALSGFLITFLLLVEKEKGIINVRNFYIRRILRIWPLYFLYLFFAVVSVLFFFPNQSLTPLPFYFLLAANIPFILGFEFPFLGHYWSLGVEEQFYLFWPWLVRNSKNCKKAVIFFTICYFGLRLLCRLLEIKFNNQLPYLAVHVTRFDCMAIGSIGGILFHEKNLTFIKFSNNILIQIISWLTLVLLAFNKFHIASVLDHELISVITVFLIVNLSTNENSLIKMDNVSFDFLGKISYSIYVIHPLIIFYYAKFLNLFVVSPEIKYILVYSGTLAITVFLSYVSYVFFESKFLLIKDRYTSVRSAGSKAFKAEEIRPMFVEVKDNLK